MFIGRVIFDEASLPSLKSLLIILVQYFHHCFVHSFYHSTRARLSFGIYSQVLSEAYGAETNLNWLEDHSEIVIITCSSFNKALSQKYPDKEEQVTVLKNLWSVLVSEPREFIQMLETIRGSLASWTKRVDGRDVNLQELNLLLRHRDIYNHIAYLVSVKEARLRDNVLESVQDEYDTIKKELSNLLIRAVPSHEALGW